MGMRCTHGILPYSLGCGLVVLLEAQSRVRVQSSFPANSPACPPTTHHRIRCKHESLPDSAIRAYTHIMRCVHRLCRPTPNRYPLVCTHIRASGLPNTGPLTITLHMRGGVLCKCNHEFPAINTPLHAPFSLPISTTLPLQHGLQYFQQLEARWLPLFAALSTTEHGTATHYYHSGAAAGPYRQRPWGSVEKTTSATATQILHTYPYLLLGLHQLQRISRGVGSAQRREELSSS